jgi:hypothetical protein
MKRVRSTTGGSASWECKRIIFIIIIQLNAAGSVAGAIKRLKGGTSRVIRKEYPELEEFLWGDIVSGRTGVLPIPWGL